MGLQKIFRSGFKYYGLCCSFSADSVTIQEKKYNPQKISVTLAFLSLMPSISKQQDHDREEMSVFKS